MKHVAEFDQVLRFSCRPTLPTSYSRVHSQSHSQHSLRLRPSLSLPLQSRPILSSLSCFVGRITFHVRSPFKKRNLPSSRPLLIDKWGAIFGSVLLTVTLAVLVGTSVLDIPVWQITVPPAVIMFIRDVVYDWYTSSPGPAPQSEAITMEKEVTSQMDTTMGVPLPQLHQGVHGSRNRLTPRYIASRSPMATTVLKRLPVVLVPFALLTFVLVQGLTRKGWVELFASGWAWWASHTGVVGVTAGMGVITCILCNVSRTGFRSPRYSERCARYAEQISGRRSSPLESLKFG